MPPLVHHVLVACVVASGLGALVMCLLVLAYGFSPATDDARERGQRRVLLTRLGHAAAGACFAFTAILTLMLLARPWPRPAPPVAVAPPAPTRDLGQDVQARIGAFGAALGDAQTRLGRIESRLNATEAAARKAGDDATVALSRIKRVERIAAEPRRATAEPTPVIVAPPPPKPVATAAPSPPRSPAPAAPVPPPPGATPAIPPSADVAPPALGPIPMSSPAAPPASPRAAVMPRATPAALPVAPDPAPTGLTPPPRPEAAPAAAAPRPAAPRAAKPPVPVARAPVPAPRRSPPAAEPRGPDLLSKLRSDWDAVKRAFDTAGDDMRNAVRLHGD